MKRASTPFVLDFTAEGRQTLKEAGEWLQTFSEEAAQRFVNVSQESLTNLCQQWSNGFRPQPDEAGSIYLAHPVFQHIIRTGQQRRRSSSGVWRIYYDVLDTDQDGLPDTLRVLSVRHAAARPLSVEDERDS